MFGLGKLGKMGRVGGVRATLASIISKYSGSHLWDFGVSADKVAYGAAYPNAYLSAELNSNPGPFTATTGYTAGTFIGGALPTLSIVSSLLRVTTAESNYGVAEMSFPTVVGKTYQVILGVSTISTGDRLIYRIGSTVQGLDYADASLASGATPSDYKRIFTATGTTCYVTFGNHATPPGSFTEFNKVTCKEVYASAAAEFAATYPTHHLYQDSAGTTPAFLPTHPVGLCLDQGTGSVGAEKVVNGTNLVNTTGWTASDLGGSTPATLSVSGGSLVVENTGTSYGAAVQAIPVTSGSTYVFTAVLSKGTAASVNIRIGAASFGWEHLDTSTTGTAVPVRVIFKAASASINVSLLNATTTDGTGIYAQVSLKEIFVLHPSQSTTTKRPVLSARVNQLVATEDFSVGNWTNVIGGTGSAPVKTPGFTDPNGGSTAWRIQCNRGAGNTSADYSVVRQAVSISGPSIYTSSIWVKSNTGATQTFNLDVANGQPVTATTSWTRVFSQQAAPGRFEISNYGPDGGTAALDILVWHPDIRPAQTPASFPAYQRVTSASDYDTAGFPLRAVWDGVDDGNSTGAVTLTSSMDLFVVMRRDSAAQLLITHGDTGNFVGACVSGLGSSACNGVGSGYTLRVDGVTVADTRDALNTAMSPNKIHLFELLGGDFSAWSNFKIGDYSGYQPEGPFADVVLVPSMSDADRVAMRNLLATKNGVTL